MSFLAGYKHGTHNNNNDKRIEIIKQMFRRYQNSLNAPTCSAAAEIKKVHDGRDIIRLIIIIESY